MGTRGGFGFRVDGVDKIGYNQYDSYPSVGGLNTLEGLRAMLAERGTEGMRELVRAVRLVTNDSKPTKEDVQKLAAVTDLGVSEQSTDDWYCLTRMTHGDIKAMAECGYILDSADFLNDSLFCEWAWIVNLDERTLECYRGFQKRKHDKGRYGPLVVKPADWKPKYKGDTFWYPVALVQSWGFEDLPTDEQFQKFWSRRKAWY